MDNKNKELEGMFNNRYKMIKKLGEGAQGTVYEVEDLKENRIRWINTFIFGFQIYRFKNVFLISKEKL